MEKSCTECGVLLPLSEFGKHAKHPGGHNYKCKHCVRAYANKWAAANRDKKRANLQAWRRKTGTTYKYEEWRAAERASWYRCRTCTPAWADRKEIRRIYQECPQGFEVDHVVPISSPHVSGLHVPENLQYLTPGENRRKSNRYDTSA